MSKPVFVYTTYIETTAERLWHALTDGDFTERYWFGHRITSDWKVGSPYGFKNQGKTTVEGQVLISDPPRRLAFSWNNRKEEAKDEGTSRVTFDLEPRGTVVKLTVTHDELSENALRDISGGWPMVIASLKSLLENGKPLPLELPSYSAKEPARA
ncbi:MAG: SRPBCC family protein [Bradyrhizobium sp.]|nr:SRPBCC family protein [Bradyrhizobium sp.]